MPVLQATEHGFDAVTPFVAALVVIQIILAGLPAGVGDIYPFAMKCFQPISIIASIRQKPISLRLVVPRYRPRVITDLPC